MVVLYQEACFVYGVWLVFRVVWFGTLRFGLVFGIWEYFAKKSVLSINYLSKRYISKPLKMAKRDTSHLSPLSPNRNRGRHFFDGYKNIRKPAICKAGNYMFCVGKVFGFAYTNNMEPADTGCLYA